MNEILTVKEASGQLRKSLVRLREQILDADIYSDQEKTGLRESPFGISLDALVNLDFSQGGLIQHVEVLIPPENWTVADLSFPGYSAKKALLVFERVEKEIEQGGSKWIDLDDINVGVEVNFDRSVVRLSIGERRENDYYFLTGEIIAGVSRKDNLLTEIWFTLPMKPFQN